MIPENVLNLVAEATAPGNDGFCRQGCWQKLKKIEKGTKDLEVKEYLASLSSQEPTWAS